MYNNFKLVISDGNTKVYENGFDMVKITTTTDGAIINKCTSFTAKVPTNINNFKQIYDFINKNDLWGEI